MSPHTPWLVYLYRPVGMSSRENDTGRWRSRPAVPRDDAGRSSRPALRQWRHVRPTTTPAHSLWRWDRVRCRGLVGSGSHSYRRDPGHRKSVVSGTRVYVRVTLV